MLDTIHTIKWTRFITINCRKTHYKSFKSILSMIMLYEINSSIFANRIYRMISCQWKLSFYIIIYRFCRTELIEDISDTLCKDYLFAPMFSHPL